MSGREEYLAALAIARQGDATSREVARKLLEAFAAGSGDAAAAIGSWYANGKYYKKNEKKAVQWFTRAAKLGSAEGYYELAVAYESGLGGLLVNKNFAFLNYLRAGIRGEPNALRSLGRCYWYGIGVGVDRKIAQIWLKRADELGVPEQIDEG